MKMYKEKIDVSKRAHIYKHPLLYSLMSGILLSVIVFFVLKIITPDFLFPPLPHIVFLITSIVFVTSIIFFARNFTLISRRKKYIVVFIVSYVFGVYVVSFISPSGYVPFQCTSRAHSTISIDQEALNYKLPFYKNAGLLRTGNSVGGTNFLKISGGIIDMNSWNNFMQQEGFEVDPYDDFFYNSKSDKGLFYFEVYTTVSISTEIPIRFTDSKEIPIAFVEAVGGLRFDNIKTRNNMEQKFIGFLSNSLGTQPTDFSVKRKYDHANCGS